MLTRGVRTIPTDSFSKWQAQCMLQPCSDSEEGSLQETSQLLETSLHDTSQESLELEKESTEESATSAYLSATASDAEFETMSTSATSERTDGKLKPEPFSLKCCCFNTKKLCMSASRGCLSCTSKACSSVRIVGFGLAGSIDEALALRTKCALVKDFFLNILRNCLRDTVSVRKR